MTNAKHPVAAFFHLLFKALALALYLFGGLFIDNYVFVFVVCILLLAFDFWTVKVSSLVSLQQSTCHHYHDSLDDMVRWITMVVVHLPPQLMTD